MASLNELVFEIIFLNFCLTDILNVIIYFVNNGIFVKLLFYFFITVKFF